MKPVLTIAGSDSGGGAGIQADLKTMEAFGCYGMSVITAVTAQNTRQVWAVRELEAQVVEQQLQAVLSDITPQAVKIGMVYTAENVELIVRALERWPHGPVVLDPVLVSTSGRALIRREAAEALERLLFPLSDVLTPNLPEAERLLQRCREGNAERQPGEPEREDWGSLQHWTDRQMEQAAVALNERYKTAILLKGGHRAGDASDVLCEDGKLSWFRGERILDRKGSHGTGCTLSTAITCGLAEGRTLKDSVEKARSYLEGALRAAPGLGQGNGPLCHGWRSLEEHVI